MTRKCAPARAHAIAIELFSSVAVNGEHVLTPTVAGDTADVRAYAATHSGGAALVLFNVNETTAQKPRC